MALPHSSLQPTDALALVEHSTAGRAAARLSAQRAFAVVVEDVLAMKRMSLPIVEELASHLIETNEDSLKHAFERQVRDEQNHIALCADLVEKAGRERGGVPPRHARLFGEVVAAQAFGEARPRLLCLATVICTAVEVAAFELLAETPESEAGASFALLARDEAFHHDLVVSLAPSLLAGASARDKVRAQRLVLSLARISFFVWWPRRVTAYRLAGLELGSFVRALAAKLDRAFRRCGIWFPRRAFEIFALASLRLCDWAGRRSSTLA